MTYSKEVCFEMFSLKEVWQDIIYTRKLILVCVVVFFIAIFIGFTSESLTVFLNQQLGALTELIDLAEQTKNKTLAFMAIIFINNAVKCVMVVFLGIFFGLYPLFFISVNGLIIGYVLKVAASGQVELSLFDTIVKGLLPHGILEIPAIILAAAYGMRLGRLLWKTIYLAIQGGSKLNGIEKTYKGTFKRCAVMCVYLIIILAVASIIESTLTMWLLSL